MAEVRNLTALVVDDEKEIGNILVEVLQRKGVNTDFVATTTEGLGLLAQRNYDLIFTDLNQRPTGVEVYKKAMEKGIEAYIMTGGAKDELLEEAEAITGGNKLLKKPFELVVIDRIVEQAKQKYDPQS